METLNLTSSAITPPPVASPARPATAAATSLADAPRCAHGEFDGRPWYYRREFNRLLADTPASAWADPKGQRWQLVKRNARREVWRAVIQDTPFYLKYYSRDTGLRALAGLFRDTACRAEWQGGLYALRAGVAAAQPVAYTTALHRGRRRCALLITQAIEPAQPLGEFWSQLSSDHDLARRRADQTQLIELLAELIARAHQAGFEHLDMHAANILVQPIAPRRYRTVFVDLQSARRGVPLSARAVVRNLAQLNQWFRRHSTIGDRLRFLRAYLRWRNEFETTCEHGRPLDLPFERFVAALAAQAHHHAQRLWARRDRRAVRNGRYFTRLKLTGGWRGLAVIRCKHPSAESCASQLEFDRAWWRGQLARPLRWFGQNAAPACKDSHSAAVCRIRLDHPDQGLPAIVKRPRARNRWRRLVQLLPQSRSMRGWRMGHALLNRNLAAARPLAVLERRLGPLVVDNLLLTEALPDAADLDSFLHQQHESLSPTAWYRLKRRLVGLLAQQVRDLQDRGFDHRDCKASNILVVEQPRLNLLWIDMDGLCLRRRLSRRRQLRPLARLYVSLLDLPGLTRTDRLRFLKAYCARSGTPPDAWRHTWRAVHAVSAKKIRAKAARSAWKLRHYGRT